MYNQGQVYRADYNLKFFGMAYSQKWTLFKRISLITNCFKHTSYASKKFITEPWICAVYFAVSTCPSAPYATKISLRTIYAEKLLVIYGAPDIGLVTNLILKIY